VAGDVVDTSEADWDRVLNLSLTTMFLASKSAVPVVAAKGSGAIVNIGSISGVARRQLRRMRRGERRGQRAHRRHALLARPPGNPQGVPQR